MMLCCREGKREMRRKKNKKEIRWSKKKMRRRKKNKKEVGWRK